MSERVEGAGAAVELPETDLIHEPRCNTYCTPGSHHLTSGIGFPHIHRTDLAECGECQRERA